MSHDAHVTSCDRRRIERAEENDNKAWYVLMLVFAVIFYVCALAGVILMYVFFTEVGQRNVLCRSSLDDITSLLAVLVILK